MLICAACGASNSETREYCLGCLADLPPAGAIKRAGDGSVGADASSGASATVADGTPADTAMHPAEAAKRLEAPDASVAPPVLPELESLAIPDSACPRHPDMRAAGTCKRCGTFFCARCVPSVLDTNVECPNCLESKEGRDAPATIKAIIREQWITLALLGLLALGTGFAAVMAAPVGASIQSDEAHLALAGINGAVLALPFAIAALLVGLVQRMWAVWVGYVIEAIMFLLIALSSFGLNVVTALAICAPIWSLTRVLRLDELMKKYPNARTADPGT
jgi:hypothetical protein